MKLRVVQRVCIAAAIAILAIQTTAAQTPAVASAAEQGRQSAGGPRASIQVHGHWTLTIRNADGSVANRLEFDNALEPSGGAFLSGVLGRRSALTPNDAWRIVISGASETCYIYEGTLPEGIKRPGDFDGLTATAPTAGPNASRLVLVGSAKASVAQSIFFVGTAIAHKNERFGNYDSDTPFTGHPLTTPTTVVAGQTIDVTVIVSFSAGNP